jgi:hypothetical protein
MALEQFAAACNSLLINRQAFWLAAVGNASSQEQCTLLMRRWHGTAIRRHIGIKRFSDVPPVG